MPLDEGRAYRARWSGRVSIHARVADALQRAWACLYGGRREDRRFRLIRLALFFALALIWGPAFAETALKAPPQNPSQVRLSFAPVVKKVTPAVVNVYASRVETAARNPLFDDPIFRRFFGGGGDDSRVSKALGSGVIVDPSGLVVTNYHVIENMTQVKGANSPPKSCCAIRARISACFGSRGAKIFRCLSWAIRTHSKSAISSSRWAI